MTSHFHSDAQYQYTVKRSVRASYVRFVVSERGLEVVVPQNFCVSRDLPPLLEAKRDWIIKALTKMSIRRKMREGTNGVPKVIELRALNERFTVELASDRTIRFTEKNDMLLLSEDFTEPEAIAILKKWLLMKAKKTLPPQLRGLADTYGFKIAAVFVKEQKSLWGSCSSKCNINLNCRLLFLPPELMRHVMLHELCHLMEMNHSQKFHIELERLDPDARRHSQELKEAWGFVPVWSL